MRRSGWAIGSPQSNRPTWGVFETENWSGNEGRELHRLRQWLASTHIEHDLTHIVLEQVFVNANPKAFQFNGTQGQLMQSGVIVEFAEAMGIKALEVNIDDWRKRFLGINRRPKTVDGKKDKFWKDLAMRVCAQNHNIFVEFHDSAEALGILDFTLSELSREYRSRTIGVTNRTQHDADLKRGVFAE